MKRPNYTDRRPRYRSAAETNEPGYLARRFKAYKRLQRMKARNVTQLPKARKG